MRLLLLAATLALVACKPDPIEACVTAEKKSELFRVCGNADGVGCDSDSVRVIVTISEPFWRKKCMRQAAGRDD